MYLDYRFGAIIFTFLRKLTIQIENKETDAKRHKLQNPEFNPVKIFQGTFHEISILWQ